MTYNSPTQLYRDPRNAKLMGVCAGIADYLDTGTGIIRVMYVLGTLFTGIWPGIALYVFMGFILKPKPRDLYRSASEERFWKDARRAPDYTAADLRRRFRDLERRTAEMEQEVTSKQFRLEKELNDLERQN